MMIATYRLTYWWCSYEHLRCWRNQGSTKEMQWTSWHSPPESSMFVLKKPCDAIGVKQEPALIVVSWRNTPTDSGTDSPTYLRSPMIPTYQNVFDISSWYHRLSYLPKCLWYIELIPIYFCLSLFLKISLFDVPGCSMFLVLTTAKTILVPCFCPLI